MCECLKREDGTWHVDLCCADIMDRWHRDGTDESTGIIVEISDDVAYQLAHKSQRIVREMSQALHDIYGLAGWRSDDRAEESDTSPEDRVAHVNGLIRKIARPFLP